MVYLGTLNHDNDGVDTMRSLTSYVHTIYIFTYIVYDYEVSMFSHAVVLSHDDAIPLKFLPTIQVVPKEPSSSFSSMEEAILPFFVNHDSSNVDDNVVNVDHIRSTLLVRPRRVRRRHGDHSPCLVVDDDNNYPPLYAYHIPPAAATAATASSSPPLQHPNRRATRLAMACGHWSYRFYGTVVLVVVTTTMETSISPRWLHDIQVVCQGGPDLRDSILRAVSSSSTITNDHDATTTITTATNNNYNYNIHTTTHPFTMTNHSGGTISEWLGHAAQEQYQDRVTIQQFQQLFLGTTTITDDDDGTVGTVVVSVSTIPPAVTETATNTTPIHPTTTRSSSSSSSLLPTFCYTCRRPATTLCSHCHGVYFCNADCRRNGYGTRNFGRFFSFCALLQQRRQQTLITFCL